MFLVYNKIVIQTIHAYFKCDVYTVECLKK